MVNTGKQWAGQSTARTRRSEFLKSTLRFLTLELPAFWVCSSASPGDGSPFFREGSLEVQGLQRPLFNFTSLVELMVTLLRTLGLSILTGHADPTTISQSVICKISCSSSLRHDHSRHSHQVSALFSSFQQCVRQSILRFLFFPPLSLSIFNTYTETGTEKKSLGF